MGEPQARAEILNILAACYDPLVSEAHTVEQALGALDDASRLRDLLRYALCASDLAEFLPEVTRGSESQS